MNRKVLSITMCGFLVFILNGCRTDEASKTSLTFANTPDIETEQKRVQIQLDEIKMLETVKKELVRDLSTADLLQSNIVDRADATKRSICSDQIYSSSLQTFSQAASNRLRALQGEIKVYHDWLTADIGLSTNVNWTNSSHKAVPSNR